MLGLKLIHVSKSGQWPTRSDGMRTVCTAISSYLSAQYNLARHSISYQVSILPSSQESHEACEKKSFQPIANDFTQATPLPLNGILKKYVETNPVSIN